MRSRLMGLNGPYVNGALAALILMLFSFINGYSFFFNDSRTYIHGPALVLKYATGIDLGKEWQERKGADGSAPATADAPSGTNKDRPFTVNRSIYYGLLAFAGYELSDFWLTSYVQSYFVAASIAILFLTCLRLSLPAYYLTIFLLSAFTSVGIFSALMMPDIFAAILILGAALSLVFWSELRALDRVFLTVAICFAALCHASHIAILTTMIVLALLWNLFARAGRRQYAPIAVCFLAVVVGSAGLFLFDKALEHATGHKTIVLPHMMASLIYKGPGYQYLLAKCPTLDLEICKHMSRLPQYPDEFIGTDTKNGVFASADLPTQIRLSQEQTRFALGVIAYDPLGVALALLKATLEQAAFFPVESLKIGPAEAQNFMNTLPPRIAAKVTNSTIARVPQLMDFVTVSNYVTTIAGSIFIAYFLFVVARRADERTKQLAKLNWIVVFGILSNALICGGINTPVDRYQARIVWLVPLFALADFAYRRVNARATNTASPRGSEVRLTGV